MSDRGGRSSTPKSLLRYQAGCVREAALIALVDIEERGAYTAVARDRAMAIRAWEQRDQALLTELIFGTVQHRSALARRVQAHVRRPLERWVHTLLCLGAYQLLVLTKMPAHAVVDQQVRLAKRHGHEGIAKLVNAVLRKCAEEPPLATGQGESTVAGLAEAYAHPLWLVERWVSVYGVETTRAILASHQQPPPTTIRVNALKTTREEVLQRWLPATARSTTYSVDGITMPAGSGNLAHTEAYRAGLWTVQDEAAMLVADAVAPQSGMRILDACAAPGGKATHLAERMRNQGEVIALDVHAHKVRLIEEHARRLGIDIVRPWVLDALQASSQFPLESFDAILLDAPCSGLGVIRRKPDIKWNKRPEDIVAIATLQRQLLQSLYPLLRPGGVFVYSTCTLEPIENEQQWQAFLEQEPSAEPMPLPAHFPLAQAQDAMCTLLPIKHAWDGFFIARARKRT